MIRAIYVLEIGAAVLVNISALTLLVLRYIPFPATARATGIIGVCLLFFSLEHFVGLGGLSASVPRAIRRSSTAVISRLEFVLGLSVPLALCSNAWVFPLQAALVGAWTLWDRRSSGTWDVRYLAAGAGAGCCSCFPFSPGSAAKPATCISHSCPRKRTHRSRSFWSCGGRFWCWRLLSCFLRGEFRSPDSWPRCL